MHRQPTDEVVEDSEPEREERRKKEKEAKKRSRKHGKNLNQHVVVLDGSGGNGSVANSVADISDDSMEIDIRPADRILPLHRSSKTKRIAPEVLLARAESVVDISDEEPVASSSRSLTNAPNIRESCPRKDVNDDAVGPSRPAILSPPDVLLSSTSASDIEEDGDRLKLNRFAYNNATKPPAAPKACPSRALSVPTIETLPKSPPKKKPTRSTSHRFASDFSDKQLGKLMKCISCDIKWTTRKSAAQKMVHIQSCAKKNLLSDDTVRVLIRQEVCKATENPVAKEKEEGRATGISGEQAEAPPKTFLEDIVNETAAKKKGKRPEVLKTVKSVTETREDILNRARTVLGNPTANNNQSNTGTQAFGPNKLADVLQPVEELLPPSTQAFRESVLQQRGTLLQLQPNHKMMPETAKGMGNLAGVIRKTAIFDPEPSGRENDIMPSTQPFAPSKFAITDLRTSTTSEPKIHSTVVCSSASIDCGMRSRPLQTTTSSNLTLSSPPSNLTHVFATCREREPVQSPFSKGKSKAPVVAPAYAPPPTHNPPQSSVLLMEEERFNNNEHFDLPYDDDLYDNLAWNDNDDAYLHFDPDIEGQIQGPVDRQPIHTKRTPTSDNNPPQRDTAPSNEPEVSSTTWMYPKESPRAKRKQHRREDDSPLQSDVIDADLEAKIKHAILKDESLHLRILRYEPIHFEVFLKLANDHNISPRALKLKLRSFLDRQTINFHGADPASNSTRRHP